MTPKEIIGLINKIEYEYPVDKWTINDISIWPLIRLHLYFELSYKVLNSKEGHRVTIFKFGIQVLKGLLRFLQIKIFKNSHTTTIKKSDILFFSDGISFTKIQDKWYERFCDSLAQYFSNKNLSTIRLDPTYSYHIPQYKPSVLIQPYLDLILIKSYLFKKKKKFAKQLESYSEFLNHFDKLNLDIQIPSIESLSFRIDKIEKYTKLFDNFYKSIMPKALFVVSYYGDITMASILAAKRRKIPTIDIQHGVQGEYHAAYGRWLKVPVKGFDLLPKYFLCWSEEEKGIIEEWSSKINNAHKALISGNLLLNLWKKGEAPFIQLYERQFNSHKFYSNNKVAILVTLSPGQEDKNVLLQLLKVIKENQYDYNWAIRLHPLMLQSKSHVKQLLRDQEIFNYELDFISEVPLYAVLKVTSLHITYTSSVVIEAMSFNVPSIVISNYGASYFQKQIIEGWAIKAISSEEIIYNLKNLLSKVTPKNFKYRDSNDELDELYNMLK